MSVNNLDSYLDGKKEKKNNLFSQLKQLGKDIFKIVFLFFMEKTKNTNSRTFYNKQNHQILLYSKIENFKVNFLHFNDGQ